MGGGESEVAGTGDVSLHRALVDGRWLSCEHRGMLADQSEEVRPPRFKRHHVDQRQGGVRRTVQQVCAKRDGAAEVVRDDVRCRQGPMVEEVAEQLTLGAEVHRVLLELGGLPVARHVPQVHGELGAERVGKGRPEHRGPRSPVTEHDRWTGPRTAPCRRPTPPLERRVQLHRPTLTRRDDRSRQARVFTHPPPVMYPAP